MAGTGLFSGVILAGGHSTRMGHDKARIEWRDGALWEHQVRVLQDAGAAEVMLSVRPEQEWVPMNITTVYDDHPECGPLAGIVRVLERARHPHVAVLAVDLPWLPHSWFLELLARCEKGRGCVGRWPVGGSYEPLAAIYPKEMLPLALDALENGECSLDLLMDRAGNFMLPHPISQANSGYFLNLNTPADLPDGMSLPLTHHA